jgi:hypothetical protein
MEIEPLSQAEAASYPSANAADVEGLLSRYLPKRWRKVKGLAGAVAVALAANMAGGCGSEVGNSRSQTPSSPSSHVACPPQGRRDASLARAEDWVRSIYRKPTTRAALLGFSMIVVSKQNEEDVQADFSNGGQ